MVRRLSSSPSSHRFQVERYEAFRVGTLIHRQWCFGTEGSEIVKARILVAVMVLSLFYPLVSSPTPLEDDFTLFDTIHAPLPSNEWGESLAGSDISHMSEEWNVLATRNLSSIVETQISPILSDLDDYSHTS